jgi:hypothetical protein
MKLNYQKEIDKIDNCPLNNEEGAKTLYRFVTPNLDNDSFDPQSIILKPKYQDMCIAWGLSTFNSLDAAEQRYNSLSPKIKGKYKSIAKGIITDKDGIKHQSGSNENHYTYFPKQNLNLLGIFVIVKSYE